MIKTKELEALADPLARAVVDRLTARLEAGEISKADALTDPYGAYGLTEGGCRRAALAFRDLFGRGSEDAFIPFSAAWNWGEQDALRRVSLALSDPRARGHERAVVAALQAGLDIEATLRQAAAPDPESQPASVIPFPR